MNASSSDLHGQAQKEKPETEINLKEAYRILAKAYVRNHPDQFEDKEQEQENG